MKRCIKFIATLKTTKACCCMVFLASNSLCGQENAIKVVFNLNPVHGLLFLSQTCIERLSKTNLLIDSREVTVH